MSGRRRKLRVGLAALLTVCLAVVVAACGSDSGGGGGSGSEKKITGAKVIDPASMDSPPKGTIHYCQGKDTNGSAHENVAALQQEVREQGLQGRADRVPGLRRPAARAVHPAPAGQVRRLRRLQLRRDLDGGVREPEVAVRHDAVRREGEGQVHRRAARDRALRRQVLGRPGVQRRRVHLLPHRQGRRHAAGDVAGRLRRGQEDRRPRLPGRPVRGPDLRLPRARLRGRRQGALRRRQEVRDQLAREREGAPADGRRHQGRRGARRP